jgi:saccharopine dehydrogenase-like NADP-dependent oxidoreductase
MKSSETKRVLVAGASGGVGQFICREVVRLFSPHSLVVGDYKIERGRKFAKSLGEAVNTRYVDVNNRESLNEALDGIDAVIVATQPKVPHIHSVCVAHRIPCLDITVQPEFIARVKKLDSRAVSQDTLLIIMAGLFPGLSGIMVKHAVETMPHVSSIDVGLLQNTQATTGTMGIADMLGLFAQPVLFNKEGKHQSMPGFTVTRRMVYPEPFGQKIQRLVNFVEAAVISETCNVCDVNYWTSFDKTYFNGFLVLLKKIGFLKLFNRSKTRVKLARVINLSKKGSRSQPETTSVIVEVSGHKQDKPCTTLLSLIAPSDYGTTAMSVVAMTKLILSQQVSARGVRYPLEVFPLDLLMDTINCDQLKIH